MGLGHMNDIAATTTIKLLDAWKSHRLIVSDNAASIALGVKRQTISSWRHGKAHASPAFASKMATELKLDELSVLAAIEADRAYDGDDRRVWQRHGRAAFMALLLGVSLGLLPSQPGHASQRPVSPLEPVPEHVMPHYAKYGGGENYSGCGSVAGSASLPAPTSRLAHEHLFSLQRRTPARPLRPRGAQQDPATGPVERLAHGWPVPGRTRWRTSDARAVARAGLAHGTRSVDRRGQGPEKRSSWDGDCASDQKRGLAPGTFRMRCRVKRSP